MFPFHCCQERSLHSNSNNQSLILDSEVNINLILEMIKGLVTKLADAKLSDLNYNLGRLKEGVVTESGEYLDNFKTDLSLVSSLVKAETGKINEKVFNGRLQLPHISTARLNIFEGKKEETVRGVSPIESVNNRNVEINPILDEDFDDNSFTYFKDEDSFDDINFHNSSSSSSSSGNIESIFMQAKETKMREMKAAFDLLIEECSSIAEKQASNLAKSLQKKHPLNEINTGDLNNYDLQSLQLLSETLERRIGESNSDLVELLNIKDSLEQRREESLSDVRDLMSII